MIRPLTEALWEAAVLDLWPRSAVIVDFGIDSERHLGALQHAIKHGHVTQDALDKALGSGAALTRICQVPCSPYKDVVFKTSYDIMGEDEDEAEREA